MTSSSGVADQTESMMHALADHWGLIAAMGVVSILIGILAIVVPGATLITVAIFFAAWLFVSGIVSVVQSFTTDGDTAGRVLNAVIGVLINLFSNAALAMRKAGTAAPAIHTTVRWADSRLHVTVRDNGPGIAEENLARVFEPFFTTRDVGQGLGLGLSISYAVIERHGGQLFAESELGQWAAFSFDLPRAE